MDIIGEPEVTECGPYFEDYVALVRGAGILETLAGQVATIRRALSALPDSRAGFRYAEGKWSVREVIGHCSDAERVFGVRALCFARGESAALPGFDDKLYAGAAAHDLVPLSELLDEFAAVRAATLALLRHLPPEAWRRTGVAAGKPVSVRALAFIMAGHVAHHVAILRDRYGVGLGA